MVADIALTGDKLFQSVIEQLKLPLLHIANKAELSSELTPQNYSDISDIARMALKLVDSYMLSIEGSNNQILDLEPVAVGSILRSAAINLSPIANVHSCNIELKLDGSFAPVMSNYRRLEAAITMVGYSLIEAQASSNEDPGIIITAYKKNEKTKLGVFSKDLYITRDIFNIFKDQRLNLKQSLPGVSFTPAAGLMVANKIAGSLSTQFGVVKRDNLKGLAVVLSPSSQMRLIEV